MWKKERWGAGLAKGRGVYTVSHRILLLLCGGALVVMVVVYGWVLADRTPRGNVTVPAIEQIRLYEDRLRMLDQRAETQRAFRAYMDCINGNRELKRLHDSLMVCNIGYRRWMLLMGR